VASRTLKGVSAGKFHCVLRVFAVSKKKYYATAMAITAPMPSLCLSLPWSVAQKTLKKQANK
jgi:hypothetical protein